VARGAAGGALCDAISSPDSATAALRGHRAIGAAAYLRSGPGRVRGRKDRDACGHFATGHHGDVWVDVTIDAG